MDQTVKPPYCPNCFAASVASIMYGLPGFLPKKPGDTSPDWRQEVAEGRMVLGGCVIEPDSPQWHCTTCGHEWGDQQKRSFDTQESATTRNADDRRVDTYKGFQLVGAFWNGKYQGRITGHRRKLRDVEGSSVDDVINRMRAIIDSDEFGSWYRDEVIKSHRDRILSHGLAYHGASVRSRQHRTSVCFSCHASVDTKLDLECLTCHWIICSCCGACGCLRNVDMELENDD